MSDCIPPEAGELFPDECLRTTGLLLEANLAVSAAFEARAVRPLGLEREMADLLVRLTKAPQRQLRGVDIGRQLYMNAARTSRLIDRGESVGLVERRSDPDDRRAQLVTLTDKGKDLAAEFSPLMLAVIEEAVFDALSVREIATLDRLLAKLRAAAQGVAGPLNHE